MEWVFGVRKEETDGKMDVIDAIWSIVGRRREEEEVGDDGMGAEFVDESCILAGKGSANAKSKRCVPFLACATYPIMPQSSTALFYYTLPSFPHPPTPAPIAPSQPNRSTHTTLLSSSPSAHTHTHTHNLIQITTHLLLLQLTKRRTPLAPPRTSRPLPHPSVHLPPSFLPFFPPPFPSPCSARASPR